MTDKLVVGNISVSLPLLLLTLIMLLINKRKQPVSIDKGLFLVFLLVVFHNFLCYLVSGNGTILNLLIVTIFYFLLTFVFPSQLDPDEFYKVYKKVSILPLLGLVYHLVAIFVWGMSVNPLSFFPGMIGQVATDINRPMSFFSEPSHLASYFLPLYILSLYKKDWKWVAISIFSIVMSFSFLGLATSAIISMFFLLTNSEIKHRYIYTIIICLVVLYLSSLPIFSYFFERGENIASDSDASSMVRLLYGFELIQSMDISTLLWGIGAGNNISFFHEEGIFYNSLSGIIIDYGIILAVVFYFVFFVVYSYKQSQMIIALQICTLALIASSTLYFTAAFFFQYTFYFLYSNKKISNK